MLFYRKLNAAGLYNKNIFLLFCLWLDKLREAAGHFKWDFGYEKKLYLKKEGQMIFSKN